MYRVACKSRGAVAKAAAAILLMGLGGCSSLTDFASADITQVASTGLGALVGVKPAEQRNEEIELTARSPLVIPPDYNLRPPVNPAEEEQMLSAEWPEDPDVKAKELAALQAARADAEFEKVLKSRDGRSRALSPEELAAGMQTSGPAGPQGPTGQLARVEDSRALSPDELLRRHRQRQLAEQQGQPAAGTQVASSQQPAEYQTGETVEPTPPPARKGFWDRLVFWD